jgi:hypothetical protein
MGTDVIIIINLVTMLLDPLSVARTPPMRYIEARRNASKIPSYFLFNALETKLDFTHFEVGLGPLLTGFC